MMSGDPIMTAVDSGVTANNDAITAAEFIALKPRLCAACAYFQDSKCKWLDQEAYARALTKAEGHHIVSCPWNHQRVNTPCVSVKLPNSPSHTGSTVTRIVDMAAQFLTAVIGPRVDDATFQHRLAICRTCPHRREDDGHEYCGACGCPHWKRARLDVKLRFAELACPKGNWTIANSLPNLA